MSLDKLSMLLRKHLRLIELSCPDPVAITLLKDVNKRRASWERDCVSPIHRHSNPNLKILKLFSLEATERADMSRPQG